MNANRARVAARPAAFLAIAGLATSAAIAGTASGPHETVTSSFTSLDPGTASGSIYDVKYRNPHDPSQNPPAVRRVVVTGPKGVRIDTSVPARCTASDAELRAEGDAACPPGSRIGSGTVTLSVLGGAPSTNQVSVFNTDHGVIQLVKFGSFGVGVVRSTIKSRTVDTRIPTCVTGGQPPSGCPSDQAVVLASRLVFKTVIVHGRSYLTTPPTCATGGWPTKLDFYFGDGSHDSLTTIDRCKRSPGPPHPPRDHDWHPTLTR